MCLLVNQQSTSPILSDEWLSDFYSYNPDGIGVMYANNGELIVKKLLPKSAEDFIAFYREFIAGKNCAFHLRMRTHGDIDLENCHPYPILNRLEHGIDLWLMHNGILSTGNKADESKSDTWHYINDYLKPMLSANPDFTFHPSFAEIVGDHIGSSNKFILMDNEGRQTIINQSSGVYWGGLWLSNTYAWSSSTSASKNPIKNLKKQKKQANEKPIKLIRYPSSYRSGYGYGLTNGFDEYESDDTYDYYDQLYEDIELNLDDLRYMGFQIAGNVSVNQVFDFIEEFDLNSFQDLVDSVIDQNLSEDWFCLCLSDFKKARECFPYLDRKNGSKRVFAYE